MTVNSLLLMALTGWILKPGVAAPVPTVVATPRVGVLQRQPSVTKESVLAQTGVRFGISASQVPWSTTQIDNLAVRAGRRPTMLQYFVTWKEDFRAEAVAMCYEQGALPVLSWEPWAGSKESTNQPAYALAKITNGDFDPYIVRFATAVRDMRWPIAIRFAHEMNGHWYPWSEQQSGNQLGDYVKAWRHVHDTFAAVGATNVIWIWSPNILRPVHKVSLVALYPGDAYVDWIGMVGYAKTEHTAAEVFDETLTALAKVARKPVVITETGAQPGSHKAKWIKDFFGWLPKHPNVIGFIWFEFNTADGGSSDWRFTSTIGSSRAFREGLLATQLAPPPLG